MWHLQTFVVLKYQISKSMPSNIEFLLYEIRTHFINVSKPIADCPSPFLPIPLGAPLCTTSDSLRAASNSLRAASAADAAASLSAASLFAFSKSEARAFALRNSSLRDLRSFSNPICTRRSSLAVCSAFLCVVRAAVTSVLARLRSAFTAASVRRQISLYRKTSSSFAGGSGLARSARGSTGT